MKKLIKITGMTCDHCAASVENGLKALDGVSQVKVKLKKEQATVTYDESQISEDMIVAQIKEIGYQAEVV